MGRFPVSDAKEKALLERMLHLGIREEELEEKFVRSQGPGGQNVNKTSTCVQLVYPRMNLQIKCQQSRSLAQNRFTARRILVDKIEQMILGKKSKERQRFEKIRRQKRRRSRRSREKMLQAKHRHAEKKTLRRFPNIEE